MFRKALAIPLVMATLLLSGCGDNASITVKQSFSGSAAGGTLYLVISGDSKTVPLEKAGFPAGTVTDGDTHAGNKVCEIDMAVDGNSFHVVAYSTTSLPTNICQSFKNGING